MARLILPRKWTQQPTGPTYIDPGNPLTDGLIDALLPIGGFWQSVPWGLGRPKVLTAQDQTPFTNATGTTPTWGRYGKALNYVRASSHSSSRTSAPLKQATECSALVVAVPGASVAAGNPFFAYGNSSSTNPLLMLNWATSSNPEFRVRDVSGTDQTLAGTGGLFTLNNAHIVVGTRSQVQNFQRIYCDGQLTGSAAATSMAATTFDRTGVCVLSRSTLALQQSGDVFLCLAWNRALQPDEVNALSVNPWQVFASPSAALYIDAPAGGATNTNVTLSPAAFTFTARSIEAKTARNAALSPTSFAFTPASLTVPVTRKATLSPVAFSYTANDLTATFAGSVAYAVTLSPASFAFTPASLTATSTAAAPFIGGDLSWWNQRDEDRRKRDRKDRDDIRALLRKLLGLVPDEPPAEIAEAVVIAEASVERIEAPALSDTTDLQAQVVAAEAAIERLQSLLAAYEDDEDEDDLLMMVS